VIGIVSATSSKDSKPAATSDKASATASASATPERNVEVAIDVTTPHAKILVDGKDVGKSPFRASVPKDTREHQVIVSADGFLSETRTIGFDRDVRLELALAPVTHSGHAMPTATATTTTSSNGMGSDLHVQKPKHNIDEKDPYQ
jgi:hypothetical protein